MSSQEGASRSNPNKISDQESSNTKYLRTRYPPKLPTKLPNHLRGIFPEPINRMIDMFLETNNAINDLIPTIMEYSSSSDDEEFIHRPMHSQSYTGSQYVLDVLSGHSVHSYNCFRLPSNAFVQLRDILVGRALLNDTKDMSAAVQLGIFLRGVANAHSYKQLCEFFQHSLATISTYFNHVLKAIVSLAKEFVNLPSDVVQCHPYVARNQQFHPFFKNAIGVIDGTHVPTIVSRDLQNRYQNIKGFTSQNVMAAVSFDRQFVYIAYGWEGSATDMTVLQWSVEKGGFSVPQGKYYLVDSGYANSNKFIAPFRGYGYHFSEDRGRGSHKYTVSQELYNHRHAKLHNIAKITFDIWKERFKVLTCMRQYPLSVQADIVIACAVLHNFIGRHHDYDLYFNMSQTEMQHDSALGEVIDDDEDPDLYLIGDSLKGDAVRHAIATDMWQAHDKAYRRRSI